MTHNLNPKGVPFFSLVLEDLRTHRRDPLSQGFIALLVHRFGNVIKGISPLFLRKLMWFFYLILNRFSEFITGVSVLHYVRVGRRVHIWHHSGIVINAESVGDDVIIRQNTTIGERGGVEGRPIICDGVDIGCGAVVLGAVVVGKRAVIGANAVVINDVPDGAVVGGIPAKVLKSSLSNSSKLGEGDAAT